MQVQDTNSNPQFPHWVKVTRTDVDSSVNPPVSTTRTIHEGKCRNQKSGTSGMSEGVIVSDYLILMPFTETRFDTGDSTEVTDRSRTFAGIILDSYNGNLGCKIWHNKVNS